MPSYRSMSWALCAAMPMRATLMSQSSERRCDERDGEWGWRWGEREGRDGGGGGGGRGVPGLRATRERLWSGTPESGTVHSLRTISRLPGCGGEARGGAPLRRGS